VGIRSFVRRRKAVIFLIAIIVVVLYLGLNLLAYGLTYKPEACLACHIMKPYYDNWKSSGHNKVGCIDCHPYRPSTIVFSSVRYLAGTYRLPLKSSVEDKQCTVCHKPESNRIVNFRGTPFNHLEHIQKSKRGKALHCTSCHYSVVQSKTHMDVDVGVCTLCHFYTTPPQYNQNCVICHGMKRKDVKIGEVAFSHESFLKTGARCVECHSETVTGVGEVREERCRECHVEPKAEGRNPTRLHQIHISKAYVNCFRCHERMEHGKETTHFSRSIELSCDECHSTPHAPTRDMYMGMGSSHVKDMPSPMYVSRVRCTGCHTLERSLSGKDALPRSWEAKKKSCVLCHKPGFEKMAEDMKKSMASFTGELTAMLDQYGKTLRERKVPADLMEAYRADQRELQFLKEGRGEHNVKYAFEIGKKITASVQQGYKKLKIGQQPPLPGQISKQDGYCTFCHATYRPEGEIRVKALNNTVFDHALHVETGTECAKCHDPAQHRLGTGLLTSACKECHPDKKF
jgi:hypothetical protein